MVFTETDTGLLLPPSRNGHYLREAHAALEVHLLESRIAELETRLHEQGWTRLEANGGQEFSREALANIVELSRVSYLVNPLIKRAVDIAALYVWGQDLSVNAADDTVELVVDRFWQDNRATLTGQQASRLLEVELETTGNLFLALFANPVDGSVRVRTVPMEEIRAIVTNPQDRSDVWHYRREWKETPLDGGTPETKRALYPDWRYQATDRPERVGEYEVRWEAPLLHVKAGAFLHWRWGVPETYAALDWAKAYKALLEDDATRSRALARFAWKVSTSGGRQGVAQAKTKLATTLGQSGRGGETNPAPATGSAFIAGEGTNLDPIKIAGANLDPDHSKPARLMVASAMGLPDQLLSGDVDQSSLATAMSTIGPLHMKFTERRALWIDVYSDLLQWVISRDQEAPGGLLRRRQLSGDERKVELAFPDLLQKDVTEMISAITAAAPFLPDELAARLVMVALGVEDVDTELAKLKAEQAKKHAERPPVPPVPPVPPTPTQESDDLAESVSDSDEISLDDLAEMTAWYDQHFPATAGLLDAEIITPKKAT